MKRFLLAALVVVFVVVLMAVPAFASGVEFIGKADDPNYFDFSEYIPSGQYVAEFTICHSNGSTADLVSAPFVLDVSEDPDEYEAEGHTTFIYDDGVEYRLSIYMTGHVRESDYQASLNVNQEWLDDQFPGYEWNSFRLVPYSEPVSGDGAADSIFVVFTGIGGWLVTELGNVSTIFYNADTGLTLLGVLAVSCLGIAVVFVLIRIFRNFLRLRT